MEEVKRNCVNCGYLCCDTGAQSVPRYIEVAAQQRKDGKRPFALTQYSNTPHCAAPKKQLAPTDEYEALGTVGTAKHERYKSVIDRDRNCPEFRIYAPGDSPDKHKADAKAELDAEVAKVRAAEAKRLQDEQKAAEKAEIKAEKEADAEKAAIAEVTKDLVKEQKEAAALVVADAKIESKAVRDGKRAFRLEGKKYLFYALPLAIFTIAGGFYCNMSIEDYKNHNIKPSQPTTITIPTTGVINGK